MVVVDNGEDKVEVEEEEEVYEGLLVEVVVEV